MESLDYYHLVEKEMAGREKTESFLKLFMVPGMGHCFGGPGPNIFGGPRSFVSAQIAIDPEQDVHSALVHWVEKGSAPATSSQLILPVTPSTGLALFAHIRGLLVGTAPERASMQETSIQHHIAR
jgi:hypothetical protein